MSHNNIFLQNILFTDFCTVEISHVIRKCHFQQQFSFFVWVGLWVDYITRPSFWPVRLTSASSTNFLPDNLYILLENVPLLERVNMCFLHGEAPTPFSVLAHQQLDVIYLNRWMGWAWTCNTEMNPLDFYLSNHLKALVYKTIALDVNNFRHRIIDKCNVK